MHILFWCTTTLQISNICVCVQNSTWCTEFKPRLTRTIMLVCPTHPTFWHGTDPLAPCASSPVSPFACILSSCTGASPWPLCAHSRTLIAYSNLYPQRRAKMCAACVFFSKLCTAAALPSWG
jgi:hypothetical protein